MSNEPDTKRAIAALCAKATTYGTLRRYAAGDHPSVFTTEKMRDAFGRDYLFVLNWCKPIIQAALDRLVIEAWQADNDEAATEQMGSLWSDLRMDDAAPAVHASALALGEAFVVAWPGEDGNPQAFAYDADRVWVDYDAKNPHVKRCAARTWAETEADETVLELFYPDRIERYRVKGTAFSAQVNFGSPSEEVPNQYGVIPVFHFRIDRELSADVINIQNAVNLLLTNIMVGAQYHSLPQRWAIGNFIMPDKVATPPGATIQFPAGDGVSQATTVGQFTQADPTPYVQMLGMLRDGVAAITRTPIHYFAPSGSVPSGEALRVVESALVAKCERYQQQLGFTWTELAKFLFQMVGRKNVMAHPVWRPAQVQQPMMEAQTRQTNVAAGVPLHFIMREQGYTDAELEQMDEDAGRIARIQATATKTPEQLAIEQQAVIDQAAKQIGPVIEQAIAAIGDALTRNATRAIAGGAG